MKGLFAEDFTSDTTVLGEASCWVFDALIYGVDLQDVEQFL